MAARIAGRQARTYYYDSAEPQQALARGVSDQVQEAVVEQGFHTGAALFDQEWVFGTYMMAAMGLGQMAQLHPESRGEYLRVMEHCIDELLSGPVRHFDTQAWGTDALESLDTPQGHVAYLGYMNLALGLHRRMHDWEIKRMVGQKVWDEYWPDRLYNHDGCDPDGMVVLGKTPHGELVEMNRRVAESDLTIYVNLNFVPMNGGDKSMAVGLCGYESLKAHHTPKAIVESNSFMDPTNSYLASSVERIGRVAEKAVKVSAPSLAGSSMVARWRSIVRVMKIIRSGSSARSWPRMSRSTGSASPRVRATSQRSGE